MKRKIYICYSAELEEKFKKFIKTFKSIKKAAEAIGCSQSYLYQIYSCSYPFSVEMALKIKNLTNSEYDFLDYFMGMNGYGAEFKTLDQLMRLHYFKKMAKSLSLDIDTFFKFYVPIGIQQILNKPIDKVTDEDIAILKCIYKVPSTKLRYEIDSVKL